MKTEILIGRETSPVKVVEKNHYSRLMSGGWGGGGGRAGRGAGGERGGAGGG
jgi:hypothetical protein